MNSNTVRSDLVLLILMCCLGNNPQAQDGFCVVNGTIIGGAGEPTVTVTNGTD